MKMIQTEILIQATSSKVWKTLTDFEAFQEWNPFIPSIKGSLKAGEKLHISIQIPGGSSMKFTPIIQTVSPNNKLVWKGKFLIQGLFDGEHRFILESVQEGTRFLHEESFSGLLIPLLPKSFFEKTKKGFEAMNLALKRRVEEK
ncbi:MAG: SRPBCC domain-containing protein [Alphaproteobacteria bacterium]|nr:SRPBCC domain-containing protein [Alphaproteobacteria bacterium]